MMLATLLICLLAALGDPLAEARGGDYRRPRQDDLRRSRELFLRSLRASDPEPLAASWRQVGFDLAEVSSEHGIWSLGESSDRREGRGFYLFRSGLARAVAFEAPHGVPSDDMLTGELALALFEHSGAKAAAWSTVPRESVDLAHTDRSVFQEFTLAFAEEFADGMVIQIHGFRRDRRESPKGQQSDAILSYGTRRPPPELERTAECLGRALETPVGYFPDVPELGALTNEQGRGLRAVDGPTFLHLELSYLLRKRLAAQSEDLESLAKCLLEIGS